MVPIVRVTSALGGNVTQPCVWGLLGAQSFNDLGLCRQSHSQPNPTGPSIATTFQSTSIWRRLAVARSAARRALRAHVFQRKLAANDGETFFAGLSVRWTDERNSTPDFTTQNLVCSAYVRGLSLRQRSSYRAPLLLTERGFKSH